LTPASKKRGGGLPTKREGWIEREKVNGGGEVYARCDKRGTAIAGGRGKSR